MQWLKPAKEFRSLIANAESLDETANSQAPFFRGSSCRKKTKTRISHHRLAEPALERFWQTLLKTAAARLPS